MQMLAFCLPVMAIVSIGALVSQAAPVGISPGHIVARDPWGGPMYVESY